MCTTGVGLQSLARMANPYTLHIYPPNRIHLHKKALTISEGGGWGLRFGTLSVVLALNFDSQIRRLDIDDFSGLTDNPSNGIQHLTCGLQLSFFNRLIK